MDSETEHLNQFRARLEAAEANLEAATREVEALRQVVSGLETLAATAETRISSADLVLQGTARSGKGAVILEAKSGTEVADQAETPSESQRKRAPRGLPDVIKEIMADGLERTFEDVERLIAEHPKFRDHPPVSSSVSNRLNEMAKQGVLTRPAEKTYRLAQQPNGSVPPQPASTSVFGREGGQ